MNLEVMQIRVHQVLKQARSAQETLEPIPFQFLLTPTRLAVADVGGDL